MTTAFMSSCLSNDMSFSQPFVKWAGGKRGVLSQIIPLLPVDFNNYFEPFVGGGALFFELYSQGKLLNKDVYLSDINSELINAYRIVKNEPDKLISELEYFSLQHSKEFYYEIRGWDRSEDFQKIGNLLRAARFIYLNKTCFNGLHRVNKKNQNNVPIGDNKSLNICDKRTIFNASAALQIAKIYDSTYDNIVKLAKFQDLVYFDPPYYPLTSTSNFTSYNQDTFLEAEQIKLFETTEMLTYLGVYVRHSNSATTFIKNLYSEYTLYEIQANRFINSKASHRGKILEILISN